MATLKTYIKDFINLWQKLPKNNRLPKLSSINSKELEAYKDTYFLFERKDPNTVVVRQCGQYFSVAYNSQCRGMNMIDFFPGENKEKLKKALNIVFDHPCGAINSRAGFLTNGDSITMRSVTLPMLDEEGNCSYAIGLLEFVKIDGEAHLSISSNLSRSHVIAPKYLDLGFGLPTTDL